jgi:hypothetical protein
VFSILADKYIAGVAGVMKSRIDRWLIAPSGGVRSATAARIGRLAEAGIGGEAVVACDDIAQALARAGRGPAKLMGVVFVSFVTVAAALLALKRTEGERRQQWPIRQHRTRNAANAPPPPWARSCWRWQRRSSCLVPRVRSSRWAPDVQIRSGDRRREVQNR